MFATSIACEGGYYSFLSTTRVGYSRKPRLGHAWLSRTGSNSKGATQPSQASDLCSMTIIIVVTGESTIFMGDFLVGKSRIRTLLIRPLWSSYGIDGIVPPAIWPFFLLLHNSRSGTRRTGARSS